MDSKPPQKVMEAIAAVDKQVRADHPGLGLWSRLALKDGTTLMVARSFLATYEDQAKYLALFSECDAPRVHAQDDVVSCQNLAQVPIPPLSHVLEQQSNKSISLPKSAVVCAACGAIYWEPPKECPCNPGMFEWRRARVFVE